jgi:hypothetical protein
MKLRALIVAIALAASASIAQAQQAIPYFTGQPTGPGGGWDTSSPMNNVNILIGEINGILGPLSGGNPNGIFGGSTSVGFQPGGLVTLQPNPSLGPNTAIGLAPVGNGNIELFTGNQITGLGLLQFGNYASFVPATGLAACPGVSSSGYKNGGLFLGPGQTVSGYVAILDWAFRPQYMVTCGGAQNG